MLHECCKAPAHVRKALLQRLQNGRRFVGLSVSPAFVPPLSPPIVSPAFIPRLCTPWAGEGGGRGGGESSVGAGDLGRGGRCRGVVERPAYGRGGQWAREERVTGVAGAASVKVSSVGGVNPERGGAKATM